MNGEIANRAKATSVHAYVGTSDLAIVTQRQCELNGICSSLRIWPIHSAVQVLLRQWQLIRGVTDIPLEH